MQNQPTPDQDVGLVKTARLPPVDEPITDRIRQDFLKPRMFVPQHMVAQCRPVLVPVHSDDPVLEGYPNIELKGEHARFVVPPVEDFSVNREDRVVYPKEDNLSVNEDKRENREKRETDDHKMTQITQGCLETISGVSLLDTKIKTCLTKKK